MKTTVLSMDGLRDAVRRLPDGLLSETRAAALANLDEQGLPTLRHEDWKYTDLTPAIDISNRWLAAGAATASDDTLASAIESVTQSIDANWLVIANGIIDLSAFDDAAGITVTRFSESSAPFVMEKPLADFNAALLQDGLRVEIHAATERPLAFLVIDKSNNGAAVSQVNVEIEIAPGCDAEVIEYHSSAGNDDHYSNSVVALQIGQAATANYVRIQDRKIGHVQTGRLSAVRMPKTSAASNTRCSRDQK
jgi:Fe-S cluster assembly protein SufD